MGFRREPVNLFHRATSLGRCGSGVFQFASRALPETTVVRAINVNGGDAFQLPNVDAGFSPSNTFTVFNQPTPTAPNLHNSSLRLNPIPNDDGFILSASGLDPEGLYRLESSFTLNGFPNKQQFTGARVMAGISLPDEGSKYFRLREIPQ